MSGNRSANNLSSSSSSSVSEDNVAATRGRKRRSGIEDGPLLRNQGPERLINELKTVYFIPDEVAARFGEFGVAVFIVAPEDLIKEIVSENGGSARQATLVLCARGEILRLIGEAEVANGAQAAALAPDIVIPGLAANIGAAIAGGTEAKDPYEVGLTEEGKIIMLGLFGVVGGVEATKCHRMQTNSRRGDKVNGSSIIRIPELGVECQTTNRDNTVERGQGWLCAIRLSGYPKWGPLGKYNWDMDARVYMISMVLALPMEVEAREMHQRSAHLLNRLKSLAWATDHKTLAKMLACKWGIGGIQINTFEDKVGAARASSTTGDNIGRNDGLAKSLTNLTNYLGAFLDEEYVHVMDSVVTEIQDSEFLHIIEGRLLAYIVDENIGAVFRAVPIAGNIQIEEVLYSLDGPRLVALALRAAASKIVKLFRDKEQLKILKDRFAEEADSRAENNRIILRIQQESPVKGQDQKKKKQPAEVSFSAETGGPSPVKQGGKIIDYGGKKTVQIDLGGAKPVAVKKMVCVKHLAGLLRLKDSSGAVQDCDRTGSECRFGHVALRKVAIDDAMRVALRLNDKVFRDALRAKIVASPELFKK
jgi:hypothetical protein